MNTKMILAFIGGAAIGSLVCFALIKEQYDVLLEEELKAMKDHYEKELELVDADYTEELRGLVSELDDEEKKMDQYVDYVKKYSSPQEQVIKMQEHRGARASMKLSEELTDEDMLPDDILKDLEDADDQFKDYVDSRHPEDDPAEEPYTISYVEFANENQHYDKITIMYYDADGVLTDDDNDVIPDVDGLVGLDNLNNFGKYSKDPNVVHVRNEKRNVDFEICLAPGVSYQETILGIYD